MMRRVAFILGKTDQLFSQPHIAGFDLDNRADISASSPAIRAPLLATVVQVAHLVTDLEFRNFNRLKAPCDEPTGRGMLGFLEENITVCTHTLDRVNSTVLERRVASINTLDLLTYREFLIHTISHLKVVLICTAEIKCAT
ncbi:hypothetical protein A8D61_15810 [Burkholderia cenocepacia]|nr:hypothetical protein A8D61_15810 [Burkholderia cenocepacia]ONJ19589.1 hypothetical protein A8D82_11750 [Burkholderia cenocepacia]ONN80234.1 hypothetical protein A8D63_31340 [Burkholderia cenocepacia]ONN80476.1 hypothetical protein A8D62_33255 [Burkholderia cenocepacia]ONN90310.1 hypothetical protein A8D64_11995 [Burkholderia cenocepacia]